MSVASHASAEEAIGTTLAGVVVDHDENPVAGIEVRATRVMPWRPNPHGYRHGLGHLFEPQPDVHWRVGATTRVTTDDDGRFRFENLEAGANHAVQAGIPSDVASMYVRARAGSADGAALRLVLEPSRTVRLRVVDANGAPVEARLGFGLVPYARPWTGSGYRWGLTVPG